MNCSIDMSDKQQTATLYLEQSRQDAGVSGYIYIYIKNKCCYL